MMRLRRSGGFPASEDFQRGNSVEGRSFPDREVTGGEIMLRKKLFGQKRYPGISLR